MAFEAQLLAMGLSPKENEDGTFMSSSDWTQKAALHTLVKKSTLGEDKPNGEELFAVAKATANSDLAKCNMMIPIAKVAAVLPAGSANLVLEDEAILAKREGAEWNFANDLVKWRH